MHLTAPVNWHFWHLDDERARGQLARVIQEESAAFDVALLAYALMANHFHLVTMSPDAEQYRKHTSRRTPGRHFRPWPKGHQNASVISQFMREVRRKVSKLRHRDLQLSGRFWEGDYDSRPVGWPESLIARIAYDHRNPVKAKIVERAEDYYWSSARSWRFGERGPIPIDLDARPLGLSREELVEQVLHFERCKELDDCLGGLARDGVAWNSDEALRLIREFMASH
jgi:hypothetical protein